VSGKGRLLKKAANKKSLLIFRDFLEISAKFFQRSVLKVLFYTVFLQNPAYKPLRQIPTWNGFMAAAAPSLNILFKE
jgi:hypothetical protein